MAGYRHIAHGFEPVFNAQSRILIVGSFPSVQSRKNEFYYGNPNNRFWRVLSACANENLPETIEEKKRLLLAHGIALWDVIEECDIKGSSDASIKNAVPTRIERIFESASIQAVFCNGATAARLYKKFQLYKTKLEAVQLPSTSPANAAWNLERLLETWSEALGELPIVPAQNATDDCKLDDAPATSEKTKGCKQAETSSAYRYASVSVAPPASTFGVHRSMQGNKGKDTRPELLVRERLREAGLGGYRLHWKVAGHPDVAWPGKRVALFIHGCYWHRCPYCKPSMPKRNVDYWAAKFARNQERDAENIAALQAAGWKTHVVWECQLKKDKLDATMAELLPTLAEELGKELAYPCR